LENITEKMQIDNLKATIKHLLKRIEQLKYLEDTMEKMEIDKTRKDATNKVE
jgi:hypothetical protein